MGCRIHLIHSKVQGGIPHAFFAPRSCFYWAPLHFPANVFAFTVILRFCCLFCDIAFIFLYFPSVFYCFRLLPFILLPIDPLFSSVPSFFLLGSVRFPLGSLCYLFCNIVH